VTIKNGMTIHSPKGVILPKKSLGNPVTFLIFFARLGGIETLMNKRLFLVMIARTSHGVVGVL
jgi:hypothetical protein